MRGAGLHERVYLVALAVYCVMMVSAAGAMVFLVFDEPEEPQTVLKVFGIHFLVQAFLALVTFGLRVMAPDRSRRWTRVANVLFLVLLPWGTILGVYGLLKVDRAPRG